jgi:putative membrane protein
MKRTTYARFEQDELTLRDVLAIDRTIVANERTLLGYVRTTLAMLGAGAALLHFFDEQASQYAGWSFLALSIPMLGVGVYHYLQRRRSLGPLIR